MAVGDGMYKAAAGVKVVTLITLAPVKSLERRFIAVKREHNITMRVERSTKSLDVVTTQWERGSAVMKQFIVKTTVNLIKCSLG